VLATLSFLALIAFVGTTTGRFLSDVVIQIMNATVGLLLIYFGIKMFAARKG
jgi:threonine/homoserine/homoserine lactone efflux protein